MDKWTEIAEQNNFSLQKFLSSEREQLQWQGEGLSTDLLSVQNAIIMLKVLNISYESQNKIYN